MKTLFANILTLYRSSLHRQPFFARLSQEPILFAPHAHNQLNQRINLYEQNTYQRNPSRGVARRFSRWPNPLRSRYRSLPQRTNQV